MQSLLFPLPGHPACLHKAHIFVLLGPDQDISICEKTNLAGSLAVEGCWIWAEKTSCGNTEDVAWTPSMFPKSGLYSSASILSTLERVIRVPSSACTPGCCLDAAPRTVAECFVDLIL